jgi:hypothetical protein
MIFVKKIRFHGDGIQFEEKRIVRLNRGPTGSMFQHA